MILKGISEYNLLYVQSKVVDGNERKKMMNNHRQKQYHKAVEPPDKKNWRKNK